MKNTKPDIACFTPVEPVKSGISYYSELLFPYLTEAFNVDLFLDGYEPDQRIIDMVRSVYHRRDYEWRHRQIHYEMNVYHIGNNKHHQYIYPVLFRYPGVVILHDVNLHRARAYEHLNQNGLGDYIDEITYCHGEIGEQVGWMVAKGYQGELLYDRFPMLNLTCEASSGIVVHSDFAVDRIAAVTPHGQIQKINHPLMGSADKGNINPRKVLGLSEETLIITSIGFVTPGKGLESTVRAFERLLQHHPQSHYYLVGRCLEQTYKDELLSLVTAEARDKITVTGYVPENEFRNYLDASDISINLRYPSQGETSGALLRIMAAGKPVLIPWYRQFKEFPRDICVYIDLSPDEEESIYQAMTELCGDRELRERIGKSAANYVRLHHDEKTWGTKMVEFIKANMRQPRPVTALVRRSDLRHVRVMSFEEQIAVCVQNWEDDVLKDTMLKPLEDAAKELGLYE